MTKEIYRSKQKENNRNDCNIVVINNTDSSKREMKFDDNCYINGLKDTNERNASNRIENNVRQFTMNDQSDCMMDPYFAFFTLV